MTVTNDDPYLLTPGPLTTSAATKEAMLRDWGSRAAEFIDTNARVRRRLLAVAGGEDTHVCVPLQGSGTFVVEATLGTLVPRDGKALMLVNGAYGERMTRMLDIMGRAYAVHETPEDIPPRAEDVDAALAADGAITHVVMVYCETTTGILNPIAGVAEVAQARKRGFIIDAMSAFGALPLDAREIPFDAAMASANKCLEGVPGMGFAIISEKALVAAKGNAHSLSLDLHAQWTSMEKDGQWRFTPPTHVIAAFDSALDQFDAEGGVEGRFRRYSANCRILVDGVRELGFETLLPDGLQAPVIVTVRAPGDPNFDQDVFFEGMRKRGYVIYPGKLSQAESFRLGCIGALDEAVMRGAVQAIAEVAEEMGIRNRAPAASF